MALDQSLAIAQIHSDELSESSLPSRRSFVKNLVAPVVGAATAAVGLLAPENAEAIGWFSPSEEPYHLTIGADFQGILLGFRGTYVDSGVTRNYLASATYHMASEPDINGNMLGFGITAKHNFSNVLFFDSNPIFSVSTGSNVFKSSPDRGFVFQIIDYNFHESLDVAYFSFMLGTNEPGLTDNIFAPRPATGTVAVTGGFGIPQTYQNPQPPDKGAALGGPVRIMEPGFGGLTGDYVSTLGGNPGTGPANSVWGTNGDSGFPLVAMNNSFDITNPLDEATTNVIYGIGVTATTFSTNYVQTFPLDGWAADYRASQNVPEPSTGLLLASATLSLLGLSRFGSQVRNSK